MNIETDYLVIGAGATGMAFVDTLISETDDNVVMIDDRPLPGGHWNEAYPYVRLHQPASTYGVSSTDLGLGRIESSGTNKGFEELSSGVEIAHYYHSLMADRFQKSGQVQFLPMTRYGEDGEIASLLSGETHNIKVRKKTVFANYITTRIPAFHKRKFEVADDVTCIIPNELPHLASGHQNICVLGTGKTATDSINWLLQHGFDPENISWVVPRDAWFLNRANYQTLDSFFESTVGGQSKSIEIYATSKSVREIEERMEAEHLWLRVNQNIWPTMFHAAIVTETEIEQLRQIKNVIRKGRVQKIEKGQMLLDMGVEKTDPDTLFVDCTASAVGHNVGVRNTVFQPGEIHLQVVRQFQPCFSAAILALIEAKIPEADKNSYALPAPATDVVTDALRTFADALHNTLMWTQSPEISEWRGRSRLDKYTQMITNADPNDPKTVEYLSRVMMHAGPAIENLRRLSEVHAVAA